MTARTVAPVIPPRLRPSALGHSKTGPAARRLPVAILPDVPVSPGGVLFGLGRIDASGRIADRAITSALGWQAGDRLTLTAAAGVVCARRDPAGLVTMPSKPYVTVPAALRQRCGLRPGDRVLLAVFPALDVVAAYSLAVVDQALRTHPSFPQAAAGGRS